jgi:formate hydrogenlyase transcriptional activator
MGTPPLGTPLPEPASSENRLEALIEVFDCIRSHGGLQEVFGEATARLRPLVPFDMAYVSLFDSLKQVMRVGAVETIQPVMIPIAWEVPPERSLAGKSWETQETIMLNDLTSEARFPEVIRAMRASSLQHVCALPFTTPHRKLGAIVFGRKHDTDFSAYELRLLRNATAEIALLADNELRSQEALTYEKQLREERDRSRLLLEIANTLIRNLDLRALFAAISQALRRIIRQDYASLVLPDFATQELRIYALDFPCGKGLMRPDLSCAEKRSFSARVFATGKPLLINRLQLDEFPAKPTQLLVEEGVQSICCLPLVNHGRAIGDLTVGSLSQAAFSMNDADLLSQVANQVAIAVDNALAFRQIAELKEQVTQEKLYLEDEIRTEFNFDEVIGESEALKRALKAVETVAPTDAPVLLLGETGTGKEVVARALHRLSRRSDRPFIKINCAAIPAGLLESELFGHEQGAFTGAIAQKVGRLELANKGTILLDEVGDVPLELQPKLLRALQESEFERLGSTRTIRVDVRLIAATNRDLAQMVAENRFRSDLYYRLRVFPILLPPLRDRREDIPALVRFFTHKYARRMGKRIREVPTGAMNALVNWHWPGNIRELENFIERSVILSSGPLLNVPVEELKNPGGSSASLDATLEGVERQHILEVLKDTNGVLAGPHGAAVRLGLKRTTLQARMKKLGISRNDYPPH